MHYCLMILCRKLREVLQQRLIKFFIDQSKKDPEKYATFFEDYGLFIREGIIMLPEQEAKVLGVIKEAPTSLNPQPFLW